MYVILSWENEALMIYLARFSIADSSLGRILCPKKTLNHEFCSPSRRPVHQHVEQILRDFALREEHLEDLVAEYLYQLLIDIYSYDIKQLYDTE